LSLSIWFIIQYSRHPVVHSCYNSTDVEHENLKSHITSNIYVSQKVVGCVTVYINLKCEFTEAVQH